MKRDLENLENVLDPTLWGRIISKFWMIGAMVVMACVLAGVAINQMSPIDQEWFISKKHEIEALDQEIQAAREALERHQAEVEERSGLLSWSRESDRKESERLNNHILELEHQRIELVRRFNTERASYSGAEELPNLPETE
jgi:hypothetical protein